MSDDEKDTNADDQTANQTDQNGGDNATDNDTDSNDNQPTGGPSEEQKALRLEREREDARKEAEFERTRREELERQLEDSRRSGMSDEDRFKEDREAFYKDKATAGILSEMDLSKLPVGLQNRIKKDPFRFVDEDTLNLELMRVNPNDPAQVWAAAERAAKKSLPGVIAEFTPGGDTNSQSTQETGKTVGNNPAIAQGDNVVSKDKQSLWSMPMDELAKLKKQLNK